MSLSVCYILPKLSFYERLYLVSLVNQIEADILSYFNNKIEPSKNIYLTYVGYTFFYLHKWLEWTVIWEVALVFSHSFCFFITCLNKTCNIRHKNNFHLFFTRSINLVPDNILIRVSNTLLMRSNRIHYRSALPVTVHCCLYLTGEIIL